MYKSLPKNEMTFDFKEKGMDTGLPYEGSFTVKCVLTISDKHTLELEKTRLMADTANPSNGLAGISLTLSEVRARIISAPGWWKDCDYGAGLLDENILIRLFDECVRCETKWRETLSKKAEVAADENKAQEEHDDA